MHAAEQHCLCKFTQSALQGLPMGMEVAAAAAAEPPRNAAARLLLLVSPELGGLASGLSAKMRRSCSRCAGVRCSAGSGACAGYVMAPPSSSLPALGGEKMPRMAARCAGVSSCAASGACTRVGALSACCPTT